MAERMNWDHHADHDLLTAIMQELQPTQEQLRGVMARMHSFGYTCTVKAITYCLLCRRLALPLLEFPFRVIFLILYLLRFHFILRHRETVQETG
jgi:hypothetical protein